jgi:hypothetical protein
MKKRLAVLFDGTWNTRDDRTNVARLAEEIAKVGTDGAPQSNGTTRVPARIGTTGSGAEPSAMARLGIFQKAIAGWRDNGTTVMSCTFSGSAEAHTARSLVGLIRKCGLLNSQTDDLVEQAYDLYRQRRASRQSKGDGLPSSPLQRDPGQVHRRVGYRRQPRCPADRRPYSMEP